MHSLAILDPARAGALTTAAAITQIEAEAVLEFAETPRPQPPAAPTPPTGATSPPWCAARGATPCQPPRPWPCGYISMLAHDETVRVVMKGIRRTIGTARDKETPATHAHPRPDAGRVPETKIGKRDRGLLGFGFAGAFRRAVLVALEVADLVEVADGLRVVIRHGITAATGSAPPKRCRRG